MVSIVNTTPFPHMRFSNSDNQGREFGVLLVKGAFDIGADGVCSIASEQEPINFTDACYGAVNETSLRHPSDFVSYKPVTDIILDCVAHAPEGKPAGTWQVGVGVQDEKGMRAQKVLRVYGPRWWVPKWKRELTEDEKREWKRHRDLFIGWELSEPEPIMSLPIRYEYAYGGLLPKGTDGQGKVIIQTFEYNPLGRGWIDPEWTDHTKPQPAPQIEYHTEPIKDPYRQYYPAGFGPVPPAWLPRRLLAGTFDQNWLDNIRPKWPADYDFAYNNSAAAHLMADGFLHGDVVLILLNLHAREKRFEIKLKHTDIMTMVDSNEGVTSYRLPLDTLFVEFAAADLFDCRVSVSWRLTFNRDTTEGFYIALPEPGERIEDAARMLKIPVRHVPAPSDCSTITDIWEKLA